MSLGCQVGVGVGVRVRGSVLLLLLLLLLLDRSQALAVEAPLTLAQYRAGLLRARGAALAAWRAPGRGPREARATRARLEAALPLQARVRMPTGTTVTVDNRPLLQTVSRAMGESRPAARRAGLQRFILSVNRLLAATAPAPRVLDRARAERVLSEVLSRREFQPRQKGPSAFERFLLWLERLLRQLGPGSAPAPAGGGDTLARLLLIGVVLLIAVLVARVVLLVLPEMRLRRRRDEPDAPSGELLVPQEPDALLAEAERAAAEGRYREALRLAYRAMVLRLDRAGVLPDDRSRTHWELLRELRRLAGTAHGSRLTAQGSEPAHPEPHSSLVSLLTPVTRLLDERLYGGRTATAEDFQAARAAHDQIERMLCAPA